MTSTDQAKAILQAIADEAAQKWGESWQNQLIRSYCEIERAETGNEKATPVNRRGQLLRSFSEGNTTLETLCRLSQAVGIEFELVVTRKQVRRIG